MRAASELCGLACLPATLAFDNPKSHSQAHTVEVEPQSDLNREVHSFYNKILRFEELRLGIYKILKGAVSGGLQAPPPPHSFMHVGF